AKMKQDALNEEIRKQRELFLARQEAEKINYSIDKKKYLDIEAAYKYNQKLSDSMEVIRNRADGAAKSFDAYVKSLKPEAIAKYSVEIKQISDEFTKATRTGKN